MNNDSNNFEDELFKSLQSGKDDKPSSEPAHDSDFMFDFSSDSSNTSDSSDSSETPEPAQTFQFSASPDSSGEENRENEDSGADLFAAFAETESLAADEDAAEPVPENDISSEENPEGISFAFDDSSAENELPEDNLMNIFEQAQGAGEEVPNEENFTFNFAENETPAAASDETENDFLNFGTATSEIAETEDIFPAANESEEESEEEIEENADINEELSEEKILEESAEADSEEEIEDFGEFEETEEFEEAAEAEETAKIAENEENTEDIEETEAGEEPESAEEAESTESTENTSENQDPSFSFGGFGDFQPSSDTSAGVSFDGMGFSETGASETESGAESAETSEVPDLSGNSEMPAGTDVPKKVIRRVHRPKKKRSAVVEILKFVLGACFALPLAHYIVWVVFLTTGYRAPGMVEIPTPFIQQSYKYAANFPNVPVEVWKYTCLGFDPARDLVPEAEEAEDENSKQIAMNTVPEKKDVPTDADAKTGEGLNSDEEDSLGEVGMNFDFDEKTVQQFADEKCLITRANLPEYDASEVAVNFDPKNVDAFQTCLLKLSFLKDNDDSAALVKKVREEMKKACAGENGAAINAAVLPMITKENHGKGILLVGTIKDVKKRGDLNVLLVTPDGSDETVKILHTEKKPFLKEGKHCVFTGVVFDPEKDENVTGKEVCIWRGIFTAAEDGKTAAPKKVKKEKPAEETPATAVAAPAEETPATAEAAPAEEAPAPAEAAPAEETPAPAEAAPAEETPAPAEAAPAEETPAPAEAAPAEEAPAPAEAAPAEEAPAPAEAAPAEETPAPAEAAPAEETPATAEAAPAEEAPEAAEAAPAEETPEAAEAAPAEETPAPAEVLPLE